MIKTVIIPDFQVEKIINGISEKILARLRVNNNGSVCCEDPEYVSPDVAAQILGLTPDYMRRIKDDFTHKKIGSKKGGRLLFRRDTLMEEYEKRSI